MIGRAPKDGWFTFLIQFGGCALFAVLLPYLVQSSIIEADAQDTLRNTMYGCLAAVLFGGWLLRNLTTYPGVETSFYIMPAMGSAYFLLLMTFVFARFQYNRTLLLLALILSVGWLFFYHVRLQRRRKLKVGYLALDTAAELPQVPSVEWAPITSTAVDKGLEHDALSADLRRDLPEEYERFLADIALAGVPVFHHKHLVESLTGRVQLEHLSESSFGSLIPLSAYRRFKHVLDRVLAVVALVVLLPLLALVALGVRLTSPGPVIFTQRRTGYRGEVFTLYKFRTMYAHDSSAEDRDAAMTKKDDARITPIGRWLRQTRMDELPQIINILKGEMSWIGPRPEANVLSRWYETELPFYRYRHIVRPGLTGWAQVNQGHVAEMDDVKQKLHYDFYYIKQFSPWIDALIIAKTFSIVVTGFGSR